MKLFTLGKMTGGSQGIALLELAVLMIGVCLFLLGGVQINERYNQFSLARRLVDRYVHDDSVRPLHMVQNGNELNVEVDHVSLSTYLSRMIDQAADEIDKIVDQYAFAGSYKVQMAYRVIELNQADGTVDNVGNINCFTKTESSFSSSGDCTELDQSLLSISSDTRSDGRSVYAVPTGYLGRAVSGQGSQERNQYLPYAVVLGMRVSWSIENSNGSLVNHFGLSTETFDQKLTVLRGALAL